MTQYSLFSLSTNEVILAWDMNLSCKGHFMWKTGEESSVSHHSCLAKQTCSSVSPSAVTYLQLQLHWTPQSSTTEFRSVWLLQAFQWPCALSAGDVHVGMVDRGGQLEVEVNQARGLIPKPGSKNIPGTNSSLHLLRNSTDVDTRAGDSVLCVLYQQRPMWRCMSWRMECVCPRRKPK